MITQRKNGYKCSSDFLKVCEHIIKLVTKRKTQVKKRDMVTQKYIHPLIRQANKQKPTYNTKIRKNA